MWMPCTFSTIGLHLLLLTHLASTFVLLTANMEDVKKLARKFVSESLAEKIAMYIAKATEQITTTISEENEMNANDSHHVSEENKMYNLARQGYESAQDNPKSKEDVQTKADDDNQDSQSSFEETTKSDGVVRPSKSSKTEYAVRLEGPSRYAAVRKPKTAKQYSYPLQEPRQISKGSDEDRKLKLDKSNKYLDDNSLTTGSTTLIYAEKYLADNKPARKKVIGRPYRLLSHADESEVSENPNALDNLSNNILSQKRAVDLTTRKAVYEFDQYDNKNYPRADAVATSGSVVLPKIPKKEWWEKEIPNEDSKRKSWF